jgi:SAM-dependent methyltransferase
MPVAVALREWHRLLRPGGRIAFSTMCAGSPPAGRIYRDCALGFGVLLRDPSAALGSPGASRKALEAVGFEVTAIVQETIEFTSQDLVLAWESNFRSAVHAAAQNLNAETQEAFKQAYLKALKVEEAERPNALNQASLLYVLGRRR